MTTGLAGGSRAEHSIRTRVGLQAAREAGVRLGRPSLVDDQTIQAILAARGRGDSYRLIAADLDAARVPTPGGSPKWAARAVRGLYLRHRPTTTKRNRKSLNEGDAS